VGIGGGPRRTGASPGGFPEASPSAGGVPVAGASSAGLAVGEALAEAPGGVDDAGAVRPGSAPGAVSSSDGGSGGGSARFGLAATSGSTDGRVGAAARIFAEPARKGLEGPEGVGSARICATTSALDGESWSTDFASASARAAKPWVW